MEASSGISFKANFYSKLDSFYDVCEINGSKFAIFSKKISSLISPITIDLSDYHVVFLQPLETEVIFTIKAISVISFHNLTTKNVNFKINVPRKPILISCMTNSSNDCDINTEGFEPRGIMKEQLEIILENFNKGIEGKDGPTIVDALVDTYGVIVDPTGEKSNGVIDINNMFKYFNISSKIT